MNETDGAALPAARRCGIVAVVGRTNVGKSTLVNALVGEKITIVSPSPQTTRNRISGVCNRPEGQMVLLDTPGFHKPMHRMNERMVDTAAESMREVDLIFVVVDASGPGLGPGDRHVISLLSRDGPPVFLILNKIDLVPKPSLLPILEASSKIFPFAEMIPISAMNGENVDRLTHLALARLPEADRLFPADQPTDRSERFLVAEILREKICTHTREEVPHETAVIIESWTEREDGLVKIDAIVLVEKENQKAILIGREGSMLKAMATEARLDIEKMLACKVFLKVWVRVTPGWRESPSVLKQIGLVE